MLRMADSVNVLNLPPGFPAYAGYVNGEYTTWPLLKKRFPRSRLLPITITLNDLVWAQCLDIENGDATPDQAPRFINLVPNALRMLYISRDSVPDLMQIMGAAKIERNRWKLWTAHYGFGKHICGPWTCKLPFQADGTQWVDWGEWDESLLDDNFFTLPTSRTPTQPRHPQPAEGHTGPTRL